MQNTSDIVYALVAPVADAADHARVSRDLDDARRFGDVTAVMILVARLTHPDSWTPAKAEVKATEPAAGGSGRA